MPAAGACDVVCDSQGASSRFSWAQSRAIQVVLAFGAVYLIWGSTFLGIRVAIETIPPMMMAAMQMICGGVLGLIAASLHGECAHFNIGAVTLRSLGAMSYLATIGSIVGFSAYLWLLRNVEATRVSTYAYVNPVVAVFLGWVVLGEKIGPELLGGSGFRNCLDR